MSCWFYKSPGIQWNKCQYVYEWEFVDLVGKEKNKKLHAYVLY